MTSWTPAIVPRISFLAFLASSDYTPNRFHWSRFLISSIPSDSVSPGRGHLWLLQVRKSLGVPHFKRFLRHLSVPLRSVCFPAAAYPVGTGRAAILPTIAPKSLVRWLSASISQ